MISGRSQRFEGRLAFSDIGTGAWTLHLDDGRSLRLEADANTSNLIQSRLGQRLSVEGRIDNETYGFANQGMPTLRVLRVLFG